MVSHRSKPLRRHTSLLHPSFWRAPREGTAGLRNPASCDPVRERGDQVFGERNRATADSDHFPNDDFFPDLGNLFLNDMGDNVNANSSGSAPAAQKANPAMGQGYLKKFTIRDENDRIKYAASSMQGLCSYMEDAHATILDLDGSRSTSFFGVYDGHGGANVALYCANQFHIELRKDEDYRNNLDNAVGNVFFRMDEQLREQEEWRALARRRRFSFNLLRCFKAPDCVKGTPYSEGSTACVALIRGNQIIVGSVGDSRCVLSRNGQAIDLSTDHKPNLPDERQRIRNAGGRVTRDKLIFRRAGQTRVQLGLYRVKGILAMSRSIGDFYFKSNDLPATDQMVTCNPDLRTEEITDDTEFLLIASDGVWDILSSQGAVEFVHEKLSSGTADLRTICEALLAHCFRSRDNSTVILVQFKPAARIPLAPPLGPNIPPAMVVQPSAPETSSFRNPDAGAEAKADTDSEIKEDELPLSTVPSSSQF